MSFKRSHAPFRGGLRALRFRLLFLLLLQWLIEHLAIRFHQTKRMRQREHDRQGNDADRPNAAGSKRVVWFVLRAAGAGAAAAPHRTTRDRAGRLEPL